MDNINILKIGCDKKLTFSFKIKIVEAMIDTENVFDAKWIHKE